MNFLKNLFDRKEYKINGYSLKFDETEHNWQVLKGHSILYIGDESHCRNYLSTL